MNEHERLLFEDWAKRGQIRPIFVERKGKPRYKVIDGNIRLRAAIAHHDDTILCRIHGEEGIHEIPVIQIRERKPLK